MENCNEERPGIYLFIGDYKSRVYVGRFYERWNFHKWMTRVIDVEEVQITIGTKKPLTSIVETAQRPDVVRI